MSGKAYFVQRKTPFKFTLRTVSQVSSLTFSNYVVLKREKDGSIVDQYMKKAKRCFGFSNQPADLFRVSNVRLYIAHIAAFTTQAGCDRQALFFIAGGNDYFGAFLDKKLRCRRSNAFCAAGYYGNFSDSIISWRLLWSIVNGLIIQIPLIYRMLIPVPPSTGKAWPVIKRASFEARKRSA